jgi:hypothetical protein
MLAGEIGEGIRAWREHLLRRLDGLDDQEYLWEPVDGCWSVRRRPDGHWTPDLGPRGSTWTPEDPPPVTTIAWRLWHLGGCPDPTWPAESAVTAREFADLWFAQAPQSTGGAFGAASEAIAGSIAIGRR